MLFVCYPRCSTCRKARDWLDERGVSYDFRDIKLDNPSYDELKSWIKASGLPARKFFNASGTLYKSLNLKEKLTNMSDDEQIQELSKDGMLVKRPLVVGDGFTLVGFKEKEWEERFKV
ncbi:MAG: arsenate reductase family protein [Clostridiales bacterium]|jgi:arsenate reductase|nr:arsenate reductase family protein [Clostridiales bacterium]